MECPSCGTKYPAGDLITSQLTHTISSQIHSEYAERIQKAEMDGFEKGQNKLEMENKDLVKQLTEAKAKTDLAESNELQLRSREREVKAREDKIALEIARGAADQSKITIEEEKKKWDQERAEERARWDEERRQQNERISELNRKANRSSPQVAGESAERTLDSTLRDAFGTDKIERIGKGKKGADVVQTIFTSSGNPCGKILWESKDAEKFAPTWVQKAKEDKSRVEADLCVIVTTCLPKDINHFDMKDGVYIITPLDTLPLARMLRQGVGDVALARQSNTEKNKLGVMLIDYLRSPKFKNELEMYFHNLHNLRKSLENDKDYFERSYSARKKQIEMISGSFNAVVGDIQGISGVTIANVPAIEYKKEKDTDE